VRARVITASTRAAAGSAGYVDRSGPVAVARLDALGFEVDDALVVADGEPIERALRVAVDAGFDVVVTTGGTGLTPTDRTPEATAAVIRTQVPGIAEAIRAAGVRAGIASAMLSRGLAGVADGPEHATLIVNLPGSSGGVRDGMDVLEPVLLHAAAQLRGSDHPASPATGPAAPNEAVP
jgi:molybdenum cofactor synthesis domain-containing protein